MLKSSTGARQIVLCGWCKKEMRLRMGQLRHRVKDAVNPLCCSSACQHRQHTFLRDKFSTTAE